MNHGLTAHSKQYRLISNEKVIDEIFSDAFTLWTNVNQKGFPKEQREHMILQRTKTNKKKRKKPNADIPLDLPESDQMDDEDGPVKKEQPKFVSSVKTEDDEPGPYGPRRRGRGAGLAAAIAAANASDDDL